MQSIPGGYGEGGALCVQFIGEGCVLGQSVQSIPREHCLERLSKKLEG